ncbi:MAG: Tol-Pal system protein TolB, partial [Pseudomonadota bacterium]
MTSRALSLLFAGLTALMVLAVAPRSANAQLQIDITQGVVEPLPVAITEFFGASPNDQRVGRDIAGVIAGNLERSGLFRPVNRDAFIQTVESLQVGPRFADWRVIDSQALVAGSIETQSDGRLRVEFRLWDVFAETEMTGLAYTTTPGNWRRVAHIISDAIYKRITGEEGYFDTRIVYISEEGEATRRVKRLAIMDQDGFNHRYLTDRNTLVLTPRFSPTAQEITYLAYVNNQPRVYLLNIDTGRIEVLGSFPGMTFAPRFSPDGNRVVMSQALTGNTDIYTMDLRTRQVARLTESPAIDTAP